MPARVVSASKSQRRGKVRAILASGLVLGVGAAFTLAAWTDNEWVFGGAGPNDTPGTKINEMQQNTVLPPAEAKWVDEPNANGGRLDFTIEAADLVPGKTVYAPLQLRAKAGSGDLTVTLAQAQQATPIVDPTNSDKLYSALRYRVWIGVDAENCTADGVKTGDAVKVLVADKDTGASVPLHTRGIDPFDLPKGTNGAAGAAVDLCFAMTLPANADKDLQGKNVIPVWRFTSSVGQPAV